MTSLAPMPEIIDGNGRRIRLGAVLGRGGEGTVYEIAHNTATVAKLYHRPLDPDRSDKIRIMTRLRTARLAELTAWPIDLLSLKATAQPVGLLMPRIADHKNIHHLYGPRSRLQDFPRADWRFLVRAAANIARAFAVVHDAGCVIGDVNHGSIMVAEDATIRLIDCDSFQITTPTRHFLCEVGIETFTPPELQGESFKTTIRTANSDNFGLAVMIFHLLFMGRHPFAGRYSGPGEMPIPTAIRQCRFPYGANHKAMAMEPPPGTPALAFVGDEVAALFETAFSAQAVTDGRPTARQWAEALARLEAGTRSCDHDRGHWYPAPLPACPWCRMEAQGARPLFPLALPAVSGGLDLDALWREILALGEPGPAPELPVATPTPSAAARAAGGPNRLARPVAGLVGVGLFIAGCFVAPTLYWAFAIAAIVACKAVAKRLSNAKKVDHFRTLRDEAQNRLREAQTAWQDRATHAAFQAAKEKFLKAKFDFDSLDERHNDEIDRLKRNHHALQMGHYLDGFRLEDARIKDIGSGLKRTLASYGLETAADLVEYRLGHVPGFGPKRIQQLIKWRRSLEAGFVFDPSKPIDPRDLAEVEKTMAAMRATVVAAARSAHAEALRCHRRILSSREALQPRMAALHAAAAQAAVDHAFVKG